MKIMHLISGGDVGGAKTHVIGLLEELGKEFSFTEMGRVDENNRAVRFCTSWATRPDQVKALCDKLKELA